MAATLALSAGAGHAAGRRMLVSIVPPPLAAGEYIGGFKLETENVTILAACHIPFGWATTAGMYDGRSGRMKGEGGLGGSLISPESHNLGQLEDLFLVEVEAGSAGDYAGSIEVGRYGAHERNGRSIPVTRRLLRFRPAERCPPPRP